MSYWQETPEQTRSKLETVYILARLGTTQCLHGWMDEICLFLGYLTTLPVLVLASTDVVSVLRHPLTSVWPLFLMCTINDHSWAVLLSLHFGIPHDPAKAILCKNLDKHRGSSNTSYVKVPHDLCHHCLIKNTHKPIKPPFSFIWLYTGWSKIHIKRCKWSNSVQNSLGVQKFVASRQKYKIFKYFHFCEIWVTLGKGQKKKRFTVFLLPSNIKTCQIWPEQYVRVNLPLGYTIWEILKDTLLSLVSLSFFFCTNMPSCRVCG